MSHWSLISGIYVWLRSNSPPTLVAALETAGEQKAWCRFSGNEMTNAGFQHPVLTYIFSSHRLFIEQKWKVTLHNKEVTGDPTRWGICALGAPAISQLLYSTQIWYLPHSRNCPTQHDYLHGWNLSSNTNWFFSPLCGDSSFFTLKKKGYIFQESLTCPCNNRTIGCLRLLRTLFYF